MKKTIISLCVLIVVGWVSYTIAVKNDAPDLIEQVPVQNTGSDNEVEGVIMSINTEQIAFDGPALITVRAEDGSERVIAIRSMGINLCMARPNMADVSTLRVGNKIEARGYAEADGIVVPCESADHYLRVVAQ